MLSFHRKHFWLGMLLSASIVCTQAAPESGNHTGRNLNPYHEQQLQDQIRKCASGILACSDSELRCVKQQELCQLLIRSERFDEALQVANNIYKTDEAAGERKAAHHFLMAEIYNRKMKASQTVTDMEKNRQYALSAAQEVVDKNYPAKWRVSEHARTLIRELSDPKTMGIVKQRVSMRENSAGDSAKEAIAEAQRRYLDATQGSYRKPAENAFRSQSKFARVPEKKPAEEISVAYQPQPESKSLPSEPAVTRSFVADKSIDTATQPASSRLQETGLLTSQPGAVTVTKPPILINGKPAAQSTVDDIAKNNLAQLLEAARKRKESQRNSSPYATGQNPAATR